MSISAIQTKAVALLALLSVPASSYIVLCGSRLYDQRIDPIVNPGVPSGHSHTVVGGNGMNFTMSPTEAKLSTCSTCEIQQDLSNYWTPKLYYRNSTSGLFTAVCRCLIPCHVGLKANSLRSLNKVTHPTARVVRRSTTCSAAVVTMTTFSRHFQTGSAWLLVIHSSATIPVILPLRVSALRAWVRTLTPRPMVCPPTIALAVFVPKSSSRSAGMART